MEGENFAIMKSISGDTPLRAVRDLINGIIGNTAMNRPPIIIHGIVSREATATMIMAVWGGVPLDGMGAVAW